MLVFNIHGRGEMVRTDPSSVLVKLTEAQTVLEKLKTNIPMATLEYARQCTNTHELVQHVDDSTHRRPRPFYKLLEVASRFPSIRSACQGRSLHLCAAPGDMIDAVILLGGSDWHAMSSRGNGALRFYDWHLMAKKTNGHSRVNFGDDGSGDVCSRPNAVCVVHESGMGRSDLVTADGGEVDSFGADPTALEASLVPMLRAQLATATRALAPGGCLLMRLLGTALPDTRAVIWACCELFESVSIARLATAITSGPERYLVAEGFRTNNDLVAKLDAEAWDQTVWVPSPSKHHTASLDWATQAIAEQQLDASMRCAALARHMNALGIHTASDARKHFAEHMATHAPSIERARALVSELRGHA